MKSEATAKERKRYGCMMLEFQCAECEVLEEISRQCSPSMIVELLLL